MRRAAAARRRGGGAPPGAAPSGGFPKILRCPGGLGRPRGGPQHAAPVGMTARTLGFVSLVPVLLAGCVATTTQTRTWPDPGAEWARYGRVESIRETVRRTEGNPAGGAIAGAVVGGLLGTVMSGGRAEGSAA